MPFALVTGASKGIGKAIAMELASRKKDILLVSRNASQLRELAIEIRQKFGVTVDYFALDRSEKSAAALVFNWCREKQFEIDVLVNNAGYGLSGELHRHTLEEHLNMMQLNMGT